MLIYKYKYVYILFILNGLNHIVIEDIKPDKDLMGLKGSLEVIAGRNGLKGLQFSFRNSGLSKGPRPCSEWWRIFRPWYRSPQAWRVHWNTIITTVKLVSTGRNCCWTEVRVPRIVIAAPFPRL